MLITMGGFVIIWMILRQYARRRTALQAEKRAAVLREFKSANNMELLYVSLFDNNAIGLNFSTQKVLLGSPRQPLIFDFNKIIQVDIIRDGGVLVKGPHSALLGVKQNIESRTNCLALRIIVDKRAFRVVFFEGVAAARDYHKTISVLGGLMDTYYAYLLSAIKACQKTEMTPAMKKINDFHLPKASTEATSLFIKSTLKTSD